MLLGTVDHHRRRDEVDARGEVALRRAVVRLLLVVDHLVEDGEAPAAVLNGPRHRQPTAFDEAGGELADQSPVLVLEVRVGVDAAPPLGQDLAEEAPHLLAELLLLRRETKLHARPRTMGMAPILGAGAKAVKRRTLLARHDAPRSNRFASTRIGTGMEVDDESLEPVPDRCEGGWKTVGPVLDGLDEGNAGDATGGEPAAGASGGVSEAPSTAVGGGRQRGLPPSPSRAVIPHRR